MTTSRRDLLRWQFDLTWALFEHHLERLEAHDLLWEPGHLVWTIRRNPDGSPIPDWSDNARALGTFRSRTASDPCVAAARP